MKYYKWLRRSKKEVMRLLSLLSEKLKPQASETLLGPTRRTTGGAGGLTVKLKTYWGAVASERHRRTTNDKRQTSLTAAQIHSGNSAWDCCNIVAMLDKNETFATIKIRQSKIKQTIWKAFQSFPNAFSIFFPKSFLSSTSSEEFSESSMNLA